MYLSVCLRACVVWHADGHSMERSESPLDSSPSLFLSPPSPSLYSSAAVRFFVGMLIVPDKYKKG